MNRLSNSIRLVRNRYVIALSRLVVGGIFVLAGIAKLMEPIEDFITIGRQWDILPDPLLTWYVIALPWVELVFGILLILGVFTRISAAVLSLTLVSFIIAIVINMVRGRTLNECGCFGSILHFGSTFGQMLWRDAVLLLLSALAMQVKQPWLSVDRWLKGKGA